MSKFLQRLERIGSWAEDSILVLILTTMILLAAGQIIGRNLFQTTFAQGDELLRILVLWLTLAGAVAASRADRHISIAVLDKFLPEKVYSMALVFTHLFTSTVCGLIAWHSYRFVQGSHEFGDTLMGDTPAWLLQAVIPIGFGVMTYRHVLLAFKRGLGIVKPDGET